VLGFGGGFQAVAQNKVVCVGVHLVACPPGGLIAGPDDRRFLPVRGDGAVVRRSGAR
jgi:hypothetical protein